jgi:hypothetical protein
MRARAGGPDITCDHGRRASSTLPVPAGAHSEGTRKNPMIGY